MFMYTFFIITNLIVRVTAIITHLTKHCADNKWTVTFVQNMFSAGTFVKKFFDGTFV